LLRFCCLAINWRSARALFSRIASLEVSGFIILLSAVGVDLQFLFCYTVLFCGRRDIAQRAASALGIHALCAGVRALCAGIRALFAQRSRSLRPVFAPFAHSVRALCAQRSRSLRTVDAAESAAKPASICGRQRRLRLQMLNGGRMRRGGDANRLE
jgi:hypothetical protein